MSDTVGRLAPSPSGAMHLGNAFAALLAWLSARSQGGQVLLRLEDLDLPRCPPKFSQGVMEDFRWLGLDWDNDPVRQSERSGYYDDCLARLSARDLTYPCYCTRKDLHPTSISPSNHRPITVPSPSPHRHPTPTEASAPHGYTPVYPGTCRDLTPAQRAELEAQGRRPALRLRVPDTTYSLVDGHLGPYAASLSGDVGDFVLRRGDGLYAYQLAVVADDGAMGVTEVVRGRDLLPSTPQQLYLQALLAFPHPRYCHLPLLLAPDGRRLSKREGDLSLQALGKRYSPGEVTGILAHWAGLLDTPRPVTPKELVADFAWERVPKADIFVTEEDFL